jgi:hypothetical protein
LYGYCPSDRPTERVRHSNGKTVSESGHLISVTIRAALVSRNSKLNFYDPNMMNITIRHKIYCPYPYSIRELCPRKKNYLYLYPQYPFVSDPFSSLSLLHPRHAARASFTSPRHERATPPPRRHDSPTQVDDATSVAGTSASPRRSLCRCLQAPALPTSASSVAWMRIWMRRRL